MRKDWLEDDLKDRFEDFGSEMDLEAEWSALEDRRDPEPKRRFPIWYVIAGVLLVGVTWLGYANYESDDKDTLGEVTLIDVDGDRISEIENIQRGQSDALTKTSEYQAQIVEEKKVKQHPFNQKTNQTATQITPSQSFSTLKNTLTTRTPYANTDPGIKRTYRTSSVSKQLPQIAKVETSNIMNQTRSVLSINSIDGIVSLLNDEGSLPRLRRRIKTFDKKRLTAGYTGEHFVGLVAGYSPLTSGRILANENSLDAISAGIYYKKYISSRFFLQTGLNWDRYTTSISGTDQNITTDLVEDQLLEQYFYLDGTVVDVFGEGEVTTTETANYSLYNRYQFFSIPVIVGYQLYRGNSVVLEIEGGISATVASRYDVKNFDIVNRAFQQNENLPLSSAGIISGLTALNLHYQPAQMDRLNFIGRVGASLQFNDIATDNDYVFDRFRSYQLGLGLQYRL